MVWQQEHRLAYKDFVERNTIIVFICLGFFLLLGIRLFQLQVVQGRYYRTVSENQRTHVIVERAPRGFIFDRNGHILLGNKSAFVALFYPFSQEEMPSKDVVQRLSSILNSKKDLTKAVTNGLRTGQVVRLADNLTREEMFRLQEQRMILPGISVVKEARRDYRAPKANCHLFGYLSEVTKKELETLGDEGYVMGDWIGRGGIEQLYDQVLRGQDGGWQIEVNARGHETQLVRHLMPSIGNSIHTTINARLQEVAQEELEKSYG
jgi:penicillin-binding protein 2